MSAKEAITLVIDDHGDKDPPSGFRKTFAEDKPYKSLLQRTDKDLAEILKLFDWKPDAQAWSEEYAKKDKQNVELVKFRRRVDFLVCAWRELNEDFGRGDVSCLRDIRTPFVTSRTPLRVTRDEFDAKLE